VQRVAGPVKKTRTRGTYKKKDTCSCLLYILNTYVCSTVTDPKLPTISYNIDLLSATELAKPKSKCDSKHGFLILSSELEWDTIFLQMSFIQNVNVRVAPGHVTSTGYASLHRLIPPSTAHHIVQDIQDLFTFLSNRLNHKAQLLEQISKTLKPDTINIGHYEIFYSVLITSKGPFSFYLLKTM
jgi:hypothetical protein